MSNPATMEKHAFETEKHDDEEPMIAATAVVAEDDVVQLVAPATFVAGAMFEATVDGIHFMATVPEGGVMQGEIFEVPYPSRSTLHRPAKRPRWKSDLFDCCSGGCGMCLLAFYCPLIIHAQVMERLNLTLGGCLPRVGSGERGSGIVNKIGILFTYILLIFGVYTGLLVCANNEFMPGFMLFYLLFYVVIIFVFVAQVCTRNSFRQTYNLPPVCCSTGGNDCLDDCCVTYWCSPCSVIQMATHSQDPKIHGYQCCSRTGLRKHSQRMENMEIV